MDIILILLLQDMHCVVLVEKELSPFIRVRTIIILL